MDTSVEFLREMICGNETNSGAAYINMHNTNDL